MNMQLQRPSWGPQNLDWGVLGSGSGPRGNTAVSGPMLLQGGSPLPRMPVRGPRQGLEVCPYHVFLVQAPWMIAVQRVRGSCRPHWLLVCLWGCVSEHVPHVCVSPCLAIPCAGPWAWGLGCSGHRLVSVCSGPRLGAIPDRLVSVCSGPRLGAVPDSAALCIWLLSPSAVFLRFTQASVHLFLCYFTHT